MRLQLTRGAIVAAAMFASSAGLAEDSPQGSARLDVYTDDWITVVSPSTRADVHVGENVEVQVKYALDVLSGATPAFTTDAVTSATEFDEKRHQAMLGVTYRPRAEYAVTGLYNLSLESDFVVHAFTLGLDSEILERMATVSVSYSLGLDTVGLATDDSFAEHVTRHALELGWTHILGKSTVLTLLGSGQANLCGEQVGCQASPYRYVAIFPSDMDGVVIRIRERHPEERYRGAAAARITQNLGNQFALHGGYRLYGDNWGVVGHTVDVQLAKEFLGTGLLLRLEARGTRQSTASFYRDEYRLESASMALPKYRSGDREISGVLDGLAGLRAEWTLSPLGPLQAFRLTARVARAWYSYPEYSELSRRDAWLLGGGLSAEL